jgi:hypothetical protein
MALSPFDRLEPGRRVAMGKSGWGAAMPIMAQKHNWRTEKNSLQWARGSVRRASGLVQIAITRKTRKVAGFRTRDPKRETGMPPLPLLHSFRMNARVPHRHLKLSVALIG